MNQNDTDDVRGVELLLNRLEMFYGQKVFDGYVVALAKGRVRLSLIFRLVSLLKKSRVFNALALVGLIMFFRAFRVPQQNNAIFLYGITKNNINAFDRLIGCLNSELVSSVSVNGCMPTFRDRFLSAFSFLFLWRTSAVISNSTSINPLVHVRKLVGCAAYCLYRRHSMLDNLNLICVASDHSPIAMALMQLASRNGIKTCYVQHAPVSRYFPALSTDLSILFDEKTVDIYSMCAGSNRSETQSNIVLLPPFKERFIFPQINDPPWAVGVCLSRLPSIDSLAEMLGKLSALDKVEEIFLRRHPACRADLSSLLSHEKVSVRRVDENLLVFSQSVDVALVPNSGVTIELLHHGVPTFYTPGMDDVKDDYYGFVSEGIIQKFDISMLSDPSKVNSFFDLEWEAKFSKYDVTVHHSIEDCRVAVVSSFSALI